MINRTMDIFFVGTILLIYHFDTYRPQQKYYNIKSISIFLLIQCSQQKLEDLFQIDMSLSLEAVNVKHLIQECQVCHVSTKQKNNFRLFSVVLFFHVYVSSLLSIAPFLVLFKESTFVLVKCSSVD